MAPLRRWVVAEPAHEIEAELISALKLHPLIVRCLVNRNIFSVSDAVRFLKPKLSQIPQPNKFRDMDIACSLIADSVLSGQPAVVYGDFDADGITASALLADFFARVGFPISFYIPDRMEEGYGLNIEAIRYLHSTGAKIIITVDCGIAGHEAIAEAMKLGIKVVVTDHHKVPTEGLPPADAVLSPLRDDCGFCEEVLAGVGIAFFLAAGMKKELTARGVKAARDLDMKRFLDLVAVGTIADLVPLTGANRILVKYGLDLINQNPRPGILALKQSSKLGDVRCSDVAFRMAPRLNATGRLSSARQAVKLLLTEDAQVASDIADQLNAENTKRQQIEEQIFEQASRLYESIPNHEALFTIVLADAAWHPGVVGIVASKMVEAYYRPTILLSLEGDEARGSGRSINDFDLFESLTKVEPLLIKYGGHKAAAGIRIATKNIKKFALEWERIARQTILPESLVPIQRIDAECTLAQITPDLADAIDQIAPFGMGNPSPVFALRQVPVVHKQVFKNHLKLRIGRIGEAFTAMAYGQADLAGKIGSMVDIAFVPSWNDYMGLRELLLVVRDIGN